ncbi:MAG: hypothetical protein J0I49_23400 [Pseudonocardia sp.]|jgi:hypothetical protein|uniref:hypothetical protein n=1 Tax=Pseudonocardia sp. TaxID=60912 RepID=UPI001AC118F6|nr:hypothetical protein [Pseudonocardia sp.]MBN9101033.1 hypothetical protein [Pseudonocardia sp.]
MATATEVSRRAGRRYWPVIVLEVLVALAALYGGVGLMWGNAIGMLDEWLVGTPFTSWVLPGALLLLVVAAPMTTAAALELRRSVWAGVASVVAGAAQVAWIGAQLAIMQRYNVQQPIMLACGLAVLLLAVTVHRDRSLWPAAGGGR